MRRIGKADSSRLIGRMQMHKRASERAKAKPKAIAADVRETTVGFSHHTS
jgi:hypothetical protein